MVLPYPIAATQTDAKSPVDDDLMDAIRLDLEAIEAEFAFNKSFDYEFKINGPLTNYPSHARRRLDGALIARAQSFTRCRLYMENPGSSGTLIADVRKYKRPNTPVTSILRKYSDAVQSISNIAPADATQSISRHVTQIATQSISRWKATINISSIILLGNNLARINLASAPDSDYLVADTVTIASATAGGNNGSFPIVRTNDDGFPCLIIENASAVAQLGAVGNLVLDAWAYNFTNPVSTVGFVAGESAIFASHTSGADDGTFAIYAVNSGGNNIVVKSDSIVAQGGAAGNVNTARWRYTYLSAVSTTDFIVGEKAKFSAHTSGLNDGNHAIALVNNSGNNLVIYNTAGVAQGGVAGVANTNRWIYALPSDPSSTFSAGNTAIVLGSTNPLNDGSFIVKEVNRLASNNIVVYNESGVAQGAIAGTLYHSHMVVSFSSDQSAVYSASAPSRIEFVNCLNRENNTYFDVLAQNLGGGSNFNVVIDSPDGIEQHSPSGRIALESRSIFVNLPTLALPTDTVSSTNRHMEYAELTATGGDFNSEAIVAAGDELGADLVEIPLGGASDVVIQIV